MANDHNRSFFSQFYKGWQETWLSFGKWLGGCAPVLVLVIVIAIIVLIILIGITSSFSAR